jgi:hypothetical protein
MTKTDKEKGGATGFSGLSSLLSELETDATTTNPAQEATPGTVAIPAQFSSDHQEEPLRSRAPPTELLSSASSGEAEVRNGKWMVGIGLVIGVLVLLLNNSTNKESAPAISYSAPQPVTDAPKSAAVTSNPSPLPMKESVAQQSTVLESTEVLGQQINFTNPSGYCTPGNSEREVEIMKMARSALGAWASNIDWCGTLMAPDLPFKVMARVLLHTTRSDVNWAVVVMLLAQVVASMLNFT